MLRRPAWLLVGVVVAAGLASGCRAGGGDRGELKLAVMSFNIRYGTADDGDNSWPYRRELVFDVIREQSPDLLGLQEALRFQLDELHGALDGYGEVGVGRDEGGVAGEYSAILYRTDRFEVAEQGTFWFSDQPQTPGSVGWGAGLPRICTWARLVERESGRGLYLYNVHFDHRSQESRERSARALLEAVRGRAMGEPVIVTGDFNAGADNPAMRYLLSVGESDPTLRLRDTFRVAHPEVEEVGTFNGFEGRTTGPKIDAILVSESWRVESAAIVRASKDGRYPSDHFPVVARVVYRS